MTNLRTEWKFAYLEDIKRIICSDGEIYNLKGLKLSQKPSSNGYLRIRIYNKGKESYKWVHRLVAECFIAPTKNKEVHHSDKCITHNWDTNLEVKSKSAHRKWHRKDKVKPYKKEELEDVPF